MHSASVPSIDRSPHRVVLASLALSLAGCTFPTGSLDIAGGRLTGINISGDTAVAVGDSTRLSAIGSVTGLVGLFSYDPLSDARWSTSNAAVVSVRSIPPSANDTFPAARVLVQGMNAGTATITVSARGISARWPMHVVAQPPTTRPADLAGVRLSSP